MADLDIRKDFVDGTYEVFTELFNDGLSDGIKLYLLSKKTRPNIYGEAKSKIYKNPITLVCGVRSRTLEDVQYIVKSKFKPTFIVPLKSFQENGVDVSRENLDYISKGVIEFQGAFYSIEDILPKTYIEDVFLFYHIECVEDIDIKEVLVESGGDIE